MLTNANKARNTLIMSIYDNRVSDISDIAFSYNKDIDILVIKNIFIIHFHNYLTLILTMLYIVLLYYFN